MGSTVKKRSQIVELTNMLLIFYSINIAFYNHYPHLLLSMVVLARVLPLTKYICFAIIKLNPLLIELIMRHNSISTFTIIQSLLPIIRKSQEFVKNDIINICFFSNQNNFSNHTNI